MRIFAGPNGSGKSTVIEQVRKYTSNGIQIDFGYYINADDISLELCRKGFSFAPFDINIHNKEFRNIVFASGLINKDLLKKNSLKAILCGKM
jgi:predicted ATP-binding protein involved in virulence